jgi:copper chaperone CopZ
VAAIEPDVRGATTIREQLSKHREHAVCASCHQRIDPPGFALESFDVIGGFRDRYRSIGEGDPAERGSIDPFIGISFKLGQSVDSTGELSDGRAFKDVRDYQSLLASDSSRLLRNLARQFAVYATGQAVRFTDQPLIEDVVRRTEKRKGGIRTLLHELISSPLFTGDAATIDPPSQVKVQPLATLDPPRSTMIAANLPDIETPVIRATEPTVAASDPPKYEFDAEHVVTLRVIGLFMPQRADDFRKLMKQFPETSLPTVDYESAQATIRYAADSELFRNAKPEQIVERINNRVRQLSGYTISVQLPGDIPDDKLTRIEFAIQGLDCMACSLAVHDILTRVEGVEHATASFRDGVANAWIDPNKTDRTKVEAALKQRGVTLVEDSAPAGM